MNIQNKTVLVLGGFGLVGNAIVRKIIHEKPKRIIVTSLFKNEAEEYAAKLQNDYPELPENYFIPWWGNIFVRNEFKDENRFALLEDKEKRRILMSDTMEELTDDILEKSSIYQLVMKYKPEIIIDSINSATGIAYQDVYSTYRKIKKTIKEDENRDSLVDETEKLICTLYVPQLIRHIQILYASMNKANTEIYLKIGTSGTGGMGLNIPYTHSEEKPSRVLLSKSAVAGAHTLLLFLMGRTPEGAITKEIKPTAAIAWKRIGYGEIRKHGKAVEIENIPFEDAVELDGMFSLKAEKEFTKTGNTLKSVFIDTGENGTFSRGEFETITSQGQMEYVTPEEIADDAIYEIKGGNTGHDVINALDNASLAPTYRAGFLQNSAVELLEELEKTHNVESVAFEQLGPPRLSKLLHEINILKQIYKSMPALLEESVEEMSEKSFNYLNENENLKNEIISIGIPILLPDGKKLLRGSMIKIPPYRGEDHLEINEKNLDLWTKDGWVDLRPVNMERWQNRIKSIMDEAESITASDTSSLHVRNKRFWKNFEQIDIGKVVGWIFIHEEHGKRMKD